MHAIIQPHLQYVDALQKELQIKQLSACEAFLRRVVARRIGDARQLCGDELHALRIQRQVQLLRLRFFLIELQVVEQNLQKLRTGHTRAKTIQ